MGDLALVQERVGGLMTEILGYFKPGRKITVMVRSPESPTQDFVMTSDDLGEVVKMIERRQEVATKEGT